MLKHAGGAFSKIKITTAGVTQYVSFRQGQIQLLEGLLNREQRALGQAGLPYESSCIMKLFASETASGSQVFRPSGQPHLWPISSGERRQQ